MRRSVPIAPGLTVPGLLFRVALLSLFPLAGLHAQQPDHPPFIPTRDVTVVYDVQPDGAPEPQQITVSFSGDGRLMRIDSPDGHGSTILDRDKRVMTIVMNVERVYMDIPERDELRSPFLFDASMHFMPGGHDTVDGVACNRWTITAVSGNARACITSDGVVLTEEGVDQQGAKGKLVARSVQYGPIPAMRFAPPAGYNRVAHPEGPAPYERSGGDPGPVMGPPGAPPGQ